MEPRGTGRCGSLETLRDLKRGQGYKKRKGRDWLRNMGASNSLRPQAKATFDNAIVNDTESIRNPTAFSRRSQTEKEKTPASQTTKGESAPSSKGRSPHLPAGVHLDWRKQWRLSRCQGRRGE
jgi:hypothetical protein